MGHFPLIHGNKNSLPGRILPEGHGISEPALDPAAFIIIAAGTLLLKVTAASKAVDIEVAHIGPDFLKILDQLAVCHGLHLSASIRRKYLFRYSIKGIPHWQSRRKQAIR